MRGSALVLTIALLVGVPGCAIFERPTKEVTVVVPVYENEVVLGADGKPLLLEDGSIATKKKLVGTKEEVRVVETGEKAPIEDTVGMAVPFLGAWGALAVAGASMAAGWATRSRKERLIKESEEERLRREANETQDIA